MAAIPVHGHRDTFTSPQLEGWIDTLNANTIRPVQQFAYTSGKPLFIQNDADAAKVRTDAFTNVRMPGLDTEYNRISLARTAG